MTVSEDIVQVLKERGPMALQQLNETTGHKKKTLQSKLYELRQAGKVARSADGIYQAVDAPPETQEEDADVLPPPPQDRPGPQSKEARDTPAPQA